MEVHTILLVLTLTLAAFTFGISLGVIVENRRSRKESDYHEFIEEELHSLWAFVEVSREKNSQQNERIRQEVSYTQKYLLMGNNTDDGDKIARRPTNTLVLPKVSEQNQEYYEHEDEDTLH